MISTFSNSTTIMTNLLNSALSLLAAFVLPVQVYLLLIGGVILLDSYYGAMWANKNGDKFSVLKLLKGIRNKMAIYTPAMLGVFWLDFHLLNEFVTQFINVQSAVTKIGCAILISTELASINDKINKLTGTSLRQRMNNTFKFFKESKDKYDEFKD